MGNMSYCWFRNTLADLNDCERAIGDPVEDEEEERARKNLLALCREIVAANPEDDDA